ncbi:unnamed protein product [Strongylus vulgaris]|uniref:Coiled-coil domain-containing protein 25 n=1 Tax=Strongylus vulgaris TaxID=40348 RepID=A0A3P7KRI4_STRVU|nr:unnamed protein product [Strongylus vulgaris]
MYVCFFLLEIQCCCSKQANKINNMVIKFTSNVVDPPVLLYMGVDKYENEELIKYGWPEDVWFHVDKVSSAHVYLRLPPGMTIDTIPQELIDDCCQLVKANSIEGNKMHDVGVVYTMWENLKKTGDMAVGQWSMQVCLLIIGTMDQAGVAPDPRLAWSVGATAELTMEIGRLLVVPMKSVEMLWLCDGPPVLSL